VLVVEDDPAIADLLKAILIEEGYAVHVASSGADALAFAPLHDLRVVVFDYRMGGMDGVEFYQELRALGIRAPAVMCSGWRDAPAVAKALDIPFVEKPFDLETLLRVLRQVGGAP
jgi:DNA-binding NtrC family response regulator